MASNDFRTAVNSANEIKITFTGRKTGKKFTIPVWFVANGSKLELLPVGGTGNEWYKNVVKNPKIELSVSDKKADGEARSINDRKQVEEILDKFRTKYGAGDVKTYYPGQNVAVEVTV